jgi:UV DNA damage endonuclease
MSIGYACLTLGVHNTDLKTCMIKNADEARLTSLIAGNLNALERMIDYNIKNNIHMFRISSDIIPFASSPVNKIPWAETFGERLAAIGSKIRQSGMRVSMHPGQYTVLNSPSETTAENAALDLRYHADFLDSLQVNASNKIILHIGGAYDDRQSAVQRFGRRYQALDDHIKARLIIENDDRIYNIQEVLEIGLRNGIPVVYDNLHHRVNPCREAGSDAGWISLCAQTWQPADGPQKIHYSQTDPLKKLGAHSLSIEIDEFLRFYNGLHEPKPDIMLEVKDKNISAIKCLLCAAGTGSIGTLEREWGRYKYLVLERSQPIYQEIRDLLKDKAACPALEFFRLTQSALARPVGLGDALNAAEHVWGYFKDVASVRQKADFLKGLDSCLQGRGSFG